MSKIEWENWHGKQVQIAERPEMVDRAIASAKQCGGVGYCLGGDTLVMASITEEGLEVWDCEIRRHGEPIKG